MDLGKELGAAGVPTVERFSIYIPDMDKDAQPIREVDEWIEAALNLLTDINGGATRLPSALGLWQNTSGIRIRENTSVIYSFIRNPDRFKASISTIANFLHHFGRKTNQGEVMVEFAGEQSGGFVSRAYFISDYVLTA